MKTLLNLLLALLVIAGISSCSSYDYYTAGLNRTNMSGYRSFAWMPPQGKDRSLDVSSAADLKIKDAAVASLNAKGLRLQPNNPDLLVTYRAMVGRGSKTVYASTYYGSGPGFYPGWGVGFGWGYGWGYRPYYAYGYSPFIYYGGSTAVGKEHYKEGTVIIDLIDTRTHKIVWRGFGVGEVHHNPQKNVDDLPKVIDGIISQLSLEPPATAGGRSIRS
ncbi:DUF4136 domain-containing protein [Mucilaginibacter ginsenosidivorans]|uniref:DUF4136 domain-containing protein n=1 Tax=Mucilaginibacter ginsenosidivorans TaxID=398053 RepID=A0A5B8V449_9SPHI|nr:DUF4136 domain-containing protein [Mucilaginibacter ginsenosidivorans]QEC65481.1 DUF4136 domain-containing protein [Mucilaginibacter ginsenosidivorans]